MITRIATVTTYVENQQNSLKFWTDRVGFEIKASYQMSPGASWIELAPKASEFAIVLYPKSLMPNWKELKPSIVFQCDDVEKTYNEMKSRGVEFTQTPKKMPWGTFATFVDIDGNEFLIKQ